MTKIFLITRAKEDSAEIAKSLENQGFQSIIEPIFSVEILSPKNISYNSQEIILTSANAESAIIFAKIPLEAKIFAISEESTKKLTLAGYKNIVYANRPNALSLKDLILEKAQKNLLYFCTKEITLDFKKELEPVGFKVDKIIAYKINWHKNFSQEFLTQISHKKIDFILFYSQNNAKNFAKLAKKHNLLEYFVDSTLLCLSKKIADELKNLGFKNEIKIFTNNLWQQLN